MGKFSGDRETDAGVVELHQNIDELADLPKQSVERSLGQQPGNTFSTQLRASFDRSGNVSSPRIIAE